VLKTIETTKDVETAARDLAEVVQRHGFGVLHTYDLRAKLREKGVDLPHECRILEVCNPRQAAKVLAASMDVSLALPCRIAVYEEQGKTRIGTILPTALVGIFPGAEGLGPVAKEVEEALLAMIEDAR
jgi:uncharacterized protein (DUF302 family)